MKADQSYLDYQARKLARYKAEQTEFCGGFTEKEFNKSMKQVQSKGKKATRLTYAINRRWMDYNSPQPKDWKIKKDVMRELRELYS